jgi:hypothetical protein
MVQVDRFLRLVAFGGLAVAAVLLSWPVPRPRAVWGVTVGGDMKGFAPVSSETIAPVWTLVSGSPAWTGADRLRVATGLTFAGVGIGAGVTMFLRWQKHIR